MLAFVALTARYLLPDTSRLWLHHGAQMVSGHHGPTYYSELLVTFFVVIVLATGSAVFKGAAASLVALLTTSDIATFTTALRGTFSFTSEIQHPQNHIALLFVSPLLKLLATFVLTYTITRFMSAMNHSFKDYYDESDAFFFSSIGVLWIIALEVFCHTQSIKALNLTANISYIVLDKLSYIVLFLSLFWIKRMNHDKEKLLKARDKYLQINKTEKKMTESPVLMLSLSYVVALLMSLPYFLGLQWIRNNYILLAVFFFIVGASFFLMKVLFSQTWNYMSTVVFDTTHLKSLKEDNWLGSLFVRVKPVIFLVVFGVLAGCFLLFYFKSMFMFILMAFLLLLLTTALLLTVYITPLVIGKVVELFRTKNRRNSWTTEDLFYYHRTLMPSFLKQLGIVAVMPFVAFMVITVFPKPLAAKGVHNTMSFVDTEGDVLYLDDQQDPACLPIEYKEIPDFFNKALVLQEDRSFFRQKKLLPNKSNWHGISFGFLKRRGGSNLNAQLVKNMTFLETGVYPRDMSRKMSDMIGGYMLSLIETPEDIMKEYVNVACFHGGKGYRGVNAASLYAFGRPLGKLNMLEQLYLVNTLPRSLYLQDKSIGRIPYSAVHLDERGMVKEILLTKAKLWLDGGLISKKEFNQLCRDTLTFTNCAYKGDIPVGTRLRLIESVTGGQDRYKTYITLDNERSILQAYQRLTSSYQSVVNKNGAELQAASMVVDVHTGHIVGHFSTGMTDYADYREGFPIGSLGKPAIILEMLRMGASPDMTLFDGQVGNRKTPRNANHEWSNRFMSIREMLSLSANAPFVNICDMMNPRSVFENTEASYRRMGIDSDDGDTRLCQDTYNYPLGHRLMNVDEVAQLYQTIFNDGVCLPLTTFVQPEESVQPATIYDSRHIAVIKDALRSTVESGTMSGFRNILPRGVNFYSKTGTSSRQKDGWCILSDGHILIVTWVSYGRIHGDLINLGVEPLYGSSSAGLFSVLIYNSLYRQSHHLS